MRMSMFKLSLAVFFIFLVSFGTAQGQDSRRVIVVLGSVNDGALGSANRALGGLTNAIGSYRAYFDGQDLGRVEYGSATPFYVNSNTNSFQLYEHSLLQRKSVSNSVSFRSVGRERRLGIIETVDNIFIACVNTQTINFTCQAVSEAEFRAATERR